MVTFPDVYGASTGGRSWDEAVEHAEDALSCRTRRLLCDQQEDIPLPSPIADGQVADSLTSMNRCFQSGLEHGHETARRDYRESCFEKMGLPTPAVQKLCNPDAYSHLSIRERAPGRQVVEDPRPTQPTYRNNLQSLYRCRSPPVEDWINATQGDLHGRSRLYRQAQCEGRRDCEVHGELSGGDVPGGYRQADPRGPQPHGPGAQGRGIRLLGQW